MSIEVMTLVWRADLPAMDKIVLLRLADFADRFGGNIYPAVGRVCRECGVSDRHVQRTIAKYVSTGLLVLVRAGGGRNRPSQYRMDLRILSTVQQVVLPIDETPTPAPENPDTVSPYKPENPDTVSPFPERNPDSQSQNPDTQSENPDTVSPDPSVTVNNRHSVIPPTPTIDQTTLFGHDTGRADASASGHDTGEPSIDELFEEWWVMVPRKASKGAARRAFAAALKRTDICTLKAGIMRYGAECTDRDPRYIKHPATWLNGQCWLDDPTPIPANGGPHGERPHYGSRDRDAGYSAHEALFAGGAAVAARYRKPDGH